MIFFAWILALILLVAPASFALAGPSAIQVWVGPYIAGCAGGLILELILGKGRVELPSLSSPEPTPDSTDTRAPLGPQVDIGFFARLISGGLAAVALLLVYNAAVGELSPTDLEAMSDDGDTFGWAIFIGLASPAVWTAGQRLVAARVAAMDAKLNNAASTNAIARKEVEEARSALTEAQAQNDSSVAPSADQAVIRLAEAAQPTLEEAAQSDPAVVDLNQLALTLQEDLASNLPELGLPSESLNRMRDASSKLDQALGVLESTAATLK